MYIDLYLKSNSNIFIVRCTCRAGLVYTIRMWQWPHYFMSFVWKINPGDFLLPPSQTTLSERTIKRSCCGTFQNNAVLRTCVSVNKCIGRLVPSKSIYNHLLPVRLQLKRICVLVRLYWKCSINKLSFNRSRNWFWFYVVFLKHTYTLRSQ